MIEEAYEFYINKVKPLIVPLYFNNGDMHSIDHIDSVVKYSIEILWNTYKEQFDTFKNAVIIASSLHDCARTSDNDGWCTQHEIAAIPKILAFFELYGDYFKLTTEDKYNIIQAVSTHTTEIGASSNIVSQCLHDADRIRLAKFYGYDERFFSTEYGKLLAQQ